MQRKFTPATLIAGAVIVLTILVSSLGRLPANAAPNAIVTPVTVYAAGVAGKKIVFFDRTTITSSRCSALKSTLNHEKMDLQYVIDQATPNALTVTLRHDNNNNLSRVVPGAVALAANSVDQDDFKQLNIFGASTCAYVQVTSAAPVSVTIIGVAR